MHESIINYISKYVDLTDNEINIISEQNLFKEYNKGDILLAEGEIAKECYFILKGCVRAYYLLDGEERNTSFFTENQTIAPISYHTKTASTYCLACMEDCLLAIGSIERNKKLLDTLPKLSTLVMQMNEELFIQKTIELDDFKNNSPEQRYLSLIENNPDLANRIPLYHLASYLGITQVSLSRIRKRISLRRS